MNNITLRTYSYLDSLKLQMASYMATISRGYFPVSGEACTIVEISPGIEINRLLDVALKATNVTPGIQIVERLFGLLEVHSASQADARQAGEAILRELGLKSEDRMKPAVLTSQLIKNISDHHAQLINKIRYGNMVLKGDTLYVLEIEPAGYAYYAANEAEKASHINIINVTGYGRYGRIYIAGDEAEVLVSKEIVETRLADLTGRDVIGKAE
jgi:ethanolamine utilization microcompartment shell protein EutL